MEKLKGTVIDLDTSSKYLRPEDSKAAKSSYLTEFHLGARAVRYRSPQPFVVRNGDAMLVAGRPGKNALVAVALRNATTGEVVGGPTRAAVLGIVLLLGIGLAVSIALAVWVTSALFAVFVLFAGGAAWLGRRAWQDKAAVAWVRMAMP